MAWQTVFCCVWVLACWATWMWKAIYLSFTEYFFKADQEIFPTQSSWGKLCPTHNSNVYSEAGNIFRHKVRAHCPGKLCPALSPSAPWESKCCLLVRDPVPLCSGDVKWRPALHIVQVVSVKPWPGETGEELRRRQTQGQLFLTGNFSTKNIIRLEWDKININSQNF